MYKCLFPLIVLSSKPEKTFLNGDPKFRRRKYKNPPVKRSSSPEEISEFPFVSIIRPIKGVDAFLHTSLTSTCLLDYPKPKYELILCVASPLDPAIPVIREVLSQHPDVDARLLIGEEDVGPNPKIRNMSRGYREAKGDILWILDSNIWVVPGTLSRSVRMLEGKDRGGKGYKLVHHLPIGVDAAVEQQSTPSSKLDTITTTNAEEQPLITTPSSPLPFWPRLWRTGGGRLEENFLSSSHCKFYTAINTVAVAPCVVGKSNLFRRSHLSQVTRDPDGRPENEGILAFAENICEDHLLAERLWLTPVDEQRTGARQWSRHGLGEDLVFQPVSGMKVTDYLARRTRWLRVRKYIVLSATLLEPGTESFVCSFLGSWAVTTLFPEHCTQFLSHFISEPSAWTALGVFWLFSICLWATVDRTLFTYLHSYQSVEVDKNTPPFITSIDKRAFGAWLLQWIGREGFALGVWAWAMWPGEVNWRGGRYRVRWKDCKVKEIGRDGGKRD